MVHIPPINTAHTSFGHSFGENPPGFDDFKSAMTDLDNTLGAIDGIVHFQPDQQTGSEMKEKLNAMITDVGLIKSNYDKIKSFLKASLSDYDFTYLDKNIQNLINNCETIKGLIPCEGPTKDLENLIGETNRYTMFFCDFLNKINE